MGSRKKTLIANSYYTWTILLHYNELRWWLCYSSILSFFFLPVYCCRNWNDPNDPLSSNFSLKINNTKEVILQEKVYNEYPNQWILRWLYELCFTMIGYGYMFFLTCVFIKIALMVIKPMHYFSNKLFQNCFGLQN